MIFGEIKINSKSAAMSMLTHAFSRTYRNHSLRASAILGIILLGVIGVGLLLLQVQIQFAISDLNIKTRELQKEENRLEDDFNRANSALQSLKDGQRIQTYAVDELGMIPAEMAEVSTLRASSKRLEQWRDAAQPLARPSSFEVARNREVQDELPRLETKPVNAGKSRKEESFLNLIKSTVVKDVASPS